MPSPLESIAPEDLRVLQHTRANVLLVGDASATADLVDALLPFFRPPIFRTPGSNFALPKATGGTLIVDGADRLTESDQHGLHDWLLDSNGSTRVVSTAAPRIFGLVQQNVFRDALYYRLNTVCLTVGGIRLDD